MAHPLYRPRRLRESPLIRRMVRETRLGVENVVNAVPRQCSFKFTPVAEVDSDGGHRPFGFPVQHKTVAQNCGDFFVRIKHGAEEAAVGAAKLVSEFA